MARKHIVLYPSGSGVDFYRAERSYDGIWLRSGTASWLTTLLPQVLASVEACDFSFSSFRELPLGDPSLMPLPPGAGYAVKILAPCGGYYDAQWSGILFHSESNPPAIAGERFVPESGGIRRQVSEFFSEAFVGSMRKVDRPRVELWVRHSLEIETMLPDAFDAPRWLRETHGLSAEQAAAKIAGLRSASTPAEYQRLRMAEKAKRELEAQQEEDAIFEQRRQAWLEEHAAEQEVRAYCDKLSNTHTAVPPSELPQLEKSQREIARDAKVKRAKLSRAVKSKTAAGLQQIISGDLCEQARRRFNEERQIMTTAKKELFKIMDTPFGRKSVFVGGIEDMVHNLTMEGLESGFGKAPAKAAEGSTDKPGEAPK